jgi:two-component system, sensor histidine kinase and response regulator
MHGAHFLLKPVKQSILYNTIMAAFGRGEKEKRSASGTGPLTANVLEDFKLLLVEDNPINQKVALEILKGTGAAVDVAGNGRAAVAAVRDKHYDIVLMDVQMPEMDGIQTTRIIRHELGLTALPVVALTAHTMAGDREQCLRAGMNDYVSKPIDRDQLFRVIQKNLPQTSGFGPLCSAARFQKPAAVTERPADLPGLIVQKGLERIGGSVELYIEIVQEYCDTNRNFTNEFKVLLDQKNLAAAKIKAHALKGAAGNISADELYHTAAALEKACNDSDISEIEALLTDVAQKLQVVLDSSSRLDTLL